MTGYDSELKFLDARGLAEWIDSEVGDAAIRVGEPTERMYRRWCKEGGKVGIDTADKVLNVIDLTLAFVPDHLWIRGGHKTALTVEQVREIKADPDTSPVDLAHRYGCSASHVSKIRSGSTWAHA